MSSEINHGYQILHTPTGEITEFGISAQKLTKKGESPRIKQKLRQKYGNDPDYKGEILDKNLPTRQKGLDWEQKQVDDFFDKHGRAPSRQELPRPTQTKKPPKPPIA